MSQTLSFTSQEHSIRIAAQDSPGTKTTLYSGKRPAILLLHGSGGNIDFWSNQLAGILNQAGVHLYAPHYFDRTGTRRADMQTLTNGVHVPQWLETINDALHFVAAQPRVDPARIIVAGISLGAFLGLALAARLSADPDAQQNTRIRAIIDVSGGLVAPFDDLATQCFPQTLILHGITDEVVPVSFAEDLANKLTQLGVPHRAELLAGEGHWFSPAASARILSAVTTFLQPLLH